MSAYPTLALWLDLLAVLALGSTALIALVAGAAWATGSAVLQRAAWQACTLGLLLLLLAQVAGVPALVADWLDAVPAAAPAPREPRAAAPAARVLPAPARPAMDPPPPQEAADVMQAVWWPGVVWLAGTGVFLLRVLLARGLLLLFCHRHRHSAAAPLTERAQALARRLGIRRPIRVLVAPGLRSPAAFGTWRPTVAVPADFTDAFTVAQQEVMLAHELAHLAAHDPAWHFLSDLVTAGLWWQPLAWWARLRLRAASEWAADEASLVVADGPALLAACLVEIGTRLAGPRAGWVRMAGSGFRSSLGRRVERLLQLRSPGWRPGRAWLRLAIPTSAAMLVLAAVSLGAWARPQAVSAEGLPMSVFSPPWQRSLAGLVLLATLGSAPADEGDPFAPPADPAVAQSSPAAGSSAAPAKAAPPARSGTPRPGSSDMPPNAFDSRTPAKPAPALRLRVFRLKHAQPEEVLQVLGHLLEPAAAGAGLGGMMPSGDMPGAGLMAPGGGGGAGPAGGPMGPGMLGGFLPPGAGGLGGGMGETPSWRLASDPRTRSLIVRGTEADLQMATALVSLLDAGPGKVLPKVKGLSAFRLKHAAPEEIVQVLQQLDLGGRVVPLPSAMLIIAAGPEATLREVGEVIEALDVEEKPPSE